jgi:drug/metabolite transporter (DMT)-like permease
MTVPPLIYAFWLDSFIVVFLTPIVIIRHRWSGIVEEWKTFRVEILISGFFMRFGYILVLITMALTQVSYILSIRQLSVIVGTALGITLLREEYGKIRLLGSIIICIGVLILVLIT